MDAMKTICIYLSLSFLLFTCANQSQKTEFHCLGELKEFTFKAKKINGESEKFVAHMGSKKFENYVVITLPYAPFGELLTSLQGQYGSLKSRSEAHVTVITPPEYDEVLSSFLTIKEINDLAQNSNIQVLKLQPICLGKAEAEISGATETAYFVVVQSQEVIDFRRRVYDAFVAKGGSPSRFDPENFYPHITVGFSLRDLHESDGVRKGKNACAAVLKLQR